MANDKDFILKNPVEVGGPTNVTLGTVTSNNIDLATGNYFKDTPSGTSTYSISNAGAVQSFQLEVTGGSEAVAEAFSTTLYTGTSPSTQTITNGIDLTGDGGLVWLKSRTEAQNNQLFDTERGANELLITDLTAGSQTVSNRGVTAFNSNGFDLGGGTGGNRVSNDYVSWAFKKQAKFFDVVTWTGNGALNGDTQTINHNLGTTPGMIIFKRTDASGTNWIVAHRNGTTNKALLLNSSSAEYTVSPTFDYVSNMTSTTFKVHRASDATLSTNAPSSSMVAYIFAHDTASDSMIKCDNITQVSGGTTVDLGWEPQWVLIRTTSASNWFIFDNKRGASTRLMPQSADAEYEHAAGTFDFNSDGFTLGSSSLAGNPGDTLIYVAIRAASDPDITWPSSIEFAGGVAPAAPANGETDIFTFSTDDGGTSYIGIKTADNLS